MGMWVVMMVPMMLPSLTPMLWRYRQAVSGMSTTRLNRLTALVGLGYFCVWTVLGLAVFPLGVALAAIEMHEPALARAVPVAAGVVVLIAGVFQFTSWKARHLACCREEHERDHLLPADTGMATRRAPRTPLRPLLRKSDGDPPGHRNHGPSRDGCRDGSHHCRTSRTRR
jgi:hypothetical protein